MTVQSVAGANNLGSPSATTLHQPICTTPTRVDEVGEPGRRHGPSYSFAELLLWPNLACKSQLCSPRVNSISVSFDYYWNGELTFNGISYITQWGLRENME